MPLLPTAPGAHRLNGQKISGPEHSDVRDARWRVARVRSPRRRLLLLIVAYNAESTLCQVLDRIPAEVLTSYLRESH